MIRDRKLYMLEENESEPARSNEWNDTARLKEDITFDYEEINRLGYQGVSAIHYDLIVLCAAVEFADKSYRRSNLCWTRRIRVSLPVYELKVWKSSATLRNLRKVLNLLTGDEWDFHFRPYVATEPFESIQQTRLISDEGIIYAMAYSDGIDSICVHEIYGDNDVSRRVHVGRRQQLQKNRLDYIHVPLVAKPNRIHENSGRTRGFKYSMLTSIVAHISEIQRVIVTESGQSSIGPTIQMLLNVYPDYRCHPTFFRAMEQFLDVALGFKISFEQPRLFHTKGETIQEYKNKRLKSGKDSSVLSSTRSCSLRRFNVSFAGNLHHCGVCGACLLRRISLFKADLSDPNDHYTVSDLTQNRLDLALHPGYEQKKLKYLEEIAYVNLKQLYDFANLFEMSNYTVDWHCSKLSFALDLPSDDVKEKLRKLVKNHAIEFKEFINRQGRQSFLQKLIWRFGYASR